MLMGEEERKREGWANREDHLQSVQSTENEMTWMNDNNIRKHRDRV